MLTTRRENLFKVLQLILLKFASISQNSMPLSLWIFTFNDHQLLCPAVGDEDVTLSPVSLYSTQELPHPFAVK